jgi:hypothetical protein
VARGPHVSIPWQPVAGGNRQALCSLQESGRAEPFEREPGSVSHEGAEGRQCFLRRRILLGGEMNDEGRASRPALVQVVSLELVLLLPLVLDLELHAAEDVGIAEAIGVGDRERPPALDLGAVELGQRFEGNV